ncbi:hypothetical protein HGRIS_006472 [Hohenbuehelia grisea]|uniref:Uncharacterized protein n=1 Tax=Hohenbuehelia grisea TaxID=104357 RepID=A0ABR3K005_9AGAR
MAIAQGYCIFYEPRNTSEEKAGNALLADKFPGLPLHSGSLLVVKIDRNGTVSSVAEDDGALIDWIIGYGMEKDRFQYEAKFYNH